MARTGLSIYRHNICSFSRCFHFQPKESVLSYKATRAVGEVAPPLHEQELLKHEAKEVKSGESNLHISLPIRIKEERSPRRFLVGKKKNAGETQTWARWLEKSVEVAAVWHQLPGRNFIRFYRKNSVLPCQTFGAILSYILTISSHKTQAYAS